MLFAAPKEVLDHLRNARPHHIAERAWLVTFYSIILSHVTASTPNDSDTKHKLMGNLWLAFNDARLLLEPRETSIQALVILAVHVEEFTSPSLSWALITNACRMLQALGIQHRQLSPEVRERRITMFWYLNMLDKGLAVIFNRPPTFHRAMSKDIPMPPVEQFLAFKPHLQNESTPGLFGAHYLFQLMLLTRITGDIWTCLYEDTDVDAVEVDLLLQKLNSWYEGATKMLNAAATTELPFLRTTSATASIDTGLRMPTFQYNYLTLLLTRSSLRLRSRGITASKSMLTTLDALVTDSQEVFNGIVWQLVCCPFTAFLTLFGESVSGRQQDPEEQQALLESMQQLPSFLEKMGKTNTLAARLHPIAQVLMQHARDAVAKQRSISTTTQSADTLGFDLDTATLITQLQSPGVSLPDNFFDWNSIFADTHAMLPATPVPLQSTGLTDDSSFATSARFLDPTVDWLAWDV